MSEQWYYRMFGDQEPKTIQALSAVAILLLIVGWNFLPKSRARELKYYRELVQIHDEIQSKRYQPGELTALIMGAQKSASEIANDLKKRVGSSDKSAKYLLFAARDEFPRACKAGFATESAAERAFASLLNEAAFELGLERRPRIVASAVQTASHPGT